MRQRQRQMSRNRMMAAVKDADVIVVNPIHIAVALKYDPERGAPRVVAKGSGFVAEKIRERAEEHDIPTVQDIPLARTLNRICDIDDEIPGEMFEAVAKLLAFVFTMRSRGTSSGFHRMPGSLDMAEADAMEEKRLQAKEAAERSLAASST
jgi:flagellar biosynthetic protein FlhB